MKRVLVTGAGGFLGSRLVSDLLTKGFSVRGTSRVARQLQEDAEVVVLPDLTDRVALSKAMEGVSSVVHLAARVHVMRDTSTDPLSEFRRANVDTTRALCGVARENGVESFVYLSSIKVNGEGRTTPYTVSDAANPVDPYGFSKHEAEGAVKETLGSSVRWTILRPPLVYGPGVRGNFRRLVRVANLSRRIPLPVGRIHNRRSLVFVGNLSDAIITALDSAAAASQTFLVSDGEDVSTTELIRRLAIALGGSMRTLPVNSSVLRMMLSSIGKGEEADRLFGSLTLDINHIRTTLGWRPPFTLSDGLMETAKWWSASR